MSEVQRKVDEHTGWICATRNIQDIQTFRWVEVDYGNLLWDGVSVQSDYGEGSNIVQGCELGALYPVAYDRNVDFNKNLIVRKPFIWSRRSDRLLLSADKSVGKARVYFWKLGNEPAEDFDLLQGKLSAMQTGHQHGVWWAFLFKHSMSMECWAVGGLVQEAFALLDSDKVELARAFTEGFDKGLKNMFADAHGDNEEMGRRIGRPLPPIPVWMYNNIVGCYGAPGVGNVSWLKWGELPDG